MRFAAVPSGRPELAFGRVAEHAALSGGAAVLPPNPAGLGVTGAGRDGAAAVAG